MVRQITRNELVELMKSGKKFTLVDVLPKYNYFREHIKGAISLPLADIENGVTKGLAKDDLIVTYCASLQCPASTTAAEKLISLGYKDVLDYKEGFKDYKEAGLPVQGSLCAKTTHAKGCD